MTNEESKTHLQSIINDNSPDEDDKKTIDQNQSIVSSFDATNESTKSGDSQTDVTTSKVHPNNKPVKHAVQDHSLTEDDNNRQRTLSSSSSTSSSSSSSDNQTSNIPYELLNNDDDDDDDDLSEHTKETS